MYAVCSLLESFQVRDTHKAFRTEWYYEERFVMPHEASSIESVESNPTTKLIYYLNLRISKCIVTSNIERWKIECVCKMGFIYNMTDMEDVIIEILAKRMRKYLSVGIVWWLKCAANSLWECKTRGVALSNVVNVIKFV